MMIKLYTDGATTNNGKENAFGGWAYIGVDEDKKKFLSEIADLFQIPQIIFVN